VDLHPIEEGEGYVSLLEAQAYTSHDSIAKAFGKPKSRITECVGFTKLPHETKWELMKRNLKNRSLLRHLLNMPVEQHHAYIEEASKKEETLAAPQADTASDASNTNTRAPIKREIKPFEYNFDKKGLNVPGFKWKVGEGAEKLTIYTESVRKLLNELEEHLTSVTQ
jgi:ParB-like chromosome segregation protein Spo0J